MLMKKGSIARQRMQRIAEFSRTYYTPFFTIIQAFLAKNAFFVNNDG